jgi:AraC family transcriptional regulator of adaptative response/methylated-DNA-[protein]-cysteine methyltransferase
MNDYERVARIIRYLQQHHTEQPDLASLARHAGLSASHFHRLFTAWAGVTPKDYLQCLTVEHAKARLRQGGSVLDAALDSGLSGPGRLHDLCVTLEAASPGELKRGGDGFDIHCGFTETPFGECILGWSPRGICHLAFHDKGMREAAMAVLRESWPAAHLLRNDKAAGKQAAQIFVRPGFENTPPPLRAHVRGTAFQVKVWRALLQVPTGGLVTYGHLAASIGQPGAARAVGSAVGSNPIAYMIPCHRVIRETGLLGGYRWGTVRKSAMIAWETAPRSPAGYLKRTFAEASSR